MKTAKFLFFTLIITLILIEVTLRISSTKKGHTITLFNKKWYYLAPLNAPKEFPDIRKAPGTYNIYDPDLGWSHGRHSAIAPLYYSDENGYRCSKIAYDSMKAKVSLSKDYDVVCIGDSFTHGDEVLYEETWPYYLAELTNLNILNLGVGGYGIDQAGLRYLKEKPKAKLVILGLVSGDLERACSQVYDLIGGGLKTKPVFVFKDDSVRIENRPAIYGDELRKQFEDPEHSNFLSRDQGYPQLFVWHWYDKLYLIRTLKTLPLWNKSKQSIYRNDDERLAYSIKILSYFKKVVEDEGAEFRVLILDNMNTFKDWSKASEDPWILFRKKLEEQNIAYFSYGNLLESKYVLSRDSIINKGQLHYTPFANKQIATFLSNNQEIKRLATLKMDQPVRSLANGNF